jgi:hypothetical protein
MKYATEELVRLWHKRDVNDLDYAYREYPMGCKTYKAWFRKFCKVQTIWIEGEWFKLRPATVESFLSKSTYLTHRSRYLNKTEQHMGELHDELMSRTPDYSGIRGFFRRILNIFN